MILYDIIFQSARYFGAQGAIVENAAAAASIVVRRELEEDRGECENSQQFRFEGDSLRTCDSYVAEKPIKRCVKKQPGTDGKRVKFFCPATCKKKCFTSTPISSPTDKPGPCKNSNAFGYEGDPLKTCDSYVAKKPYKRCRKVVDSNFFIVPAEDQDANKIQFYCPATCKRECKNTNEPGPCENSPAFGYKGNPLKTCDSYVAKKAYKRCRKVVDSNFFIVPAEDQDANKIRFHCPATCKRKCKNTKVPTASPSVTPTTSPTDLPTTSSSASPSATESAMEAPTSRPVDPRDTRDPVATASPSVTPTTSPTDLSTASSSASSSATESAMETPTSRPVDPRDPS